MNRFTVVYHNFGGYKIEIAPYVPSEFVICSKTVTTESEEVAIMQAIRVFIECGHMTRQTAEQKYNYQ